MAQIKYHHHHHHQGPRFAITSCVRKVKMHHVLADKEIIYAYYGNTAVDLDPLPVSCARLTMVEPALFDTIVTDADSDVK